MLPRLFHALAPPVFPGDERKTRTAWLLSSMLVTVLIYVPITDVILLVLPPLTTYKATFSLFFLTNLLFPVAAVLVLVMRQGKIREASILLAASIWAVVTVASASSGGVFSIAYQGYVVVILVAGLLLGGRAAIWAALASVSAGLAVALATDTQTVYLQFDVSPMRIWSIEAVTCAVAAVVLHRATRSMQLDLERVSLELAERRRAEERLRLTQFAVDHASIPIAWLRRDGTFAYVNAAALALYGVADAREVVDRPVWAFDDGVDAGRWNAGWEELAARGTLTFDAPLRLRNGLRIEAALDVCRMAFGDEEYALAFARDVTERARTAETLRRSENRFRALIEKSHEGIALVHPDGRIAYVSPSVREILGYESEAITGRSMYEFLHPHDEPAARSVLASFSERRGDVVRAEIRVRHGAGGYRWIQATATNLLDVEAVGAIVANFRDITERKQAEETIREWKNRYDLIVASSGFVAYECDLGTGTMSWSGSIERVFGCDPAELDGGLEQWTELVRTDDRAALHAARDAARTDGTPFELEYRMRRQGGSEIVVADRGFVVAASETAGERMLGMIEDVTARREAEERIRFLAHTVDSISECVAITGLDGTVAYVNDAFCRTTRYPREELVGAPFSHIYSANNDPDVLRAMTPAAAIGGWTGEVLLRRRDGNEFPAALSSTAIRDERGETIAIAGIASDISARTLADEALRFSEQRFRILAEASFEGIALAERGVIVEANDQFAHMLGTDREAVVGTPLIETVAPASRAFVEEMSRGDIESHIEFDCIRRDGTVFPAEARTRSIRVSGRRLTVAATRDITDRKRSEEQLLRQLAQLQSIYRLSDAVGRADTVETVIAEAIAALLDTWGAERAGIFVRDDAGELRVAASHGLSDAYRRWAESFDPWGSDVANPQPVVYSDTAAPEVPAELRERTRAEGIRSLVLVPLVHHDRLLGRFSICFDVARDIGDVRLAQTIASHVAFAIERTRVERALRVSEEKYRTIVENIQDVFYQVDAEGRIVTCSPSIERYSGYRPSEVIGRPVTMLYADPGEREAFVAAVEAHGEVIDYPLHMLRRDRSVLPVSINCRVVRNADGGIAGIEGTVRDVSERMRAEGELRKLSRALHQSPAAVVIMDALGRIEFVNRKYTEMYGIAEDDAIGTVHRLLDPLATPLPHPRELQRALRFGEEWHGELLSPKHDGTYFWETITFSPVRNDAGDITHAIAIHEDVTVRKNAERELIEAKERAERSERLKDAFIANISHEIRTPLNVIIGFSNVIRDMFADRLPENEREIFAGVESGGARLMRTVEQILSIATIESKTYRVQPERIVVTDNLQRLVRELRGLADEQGLALSFASECADCAVVADSYAFDQIFINLLENALKYTPAGEVELSVATSGDRVHVAVRDTGIGISEEYLPYLFDVFSQEVSGYTRPYEGIGLGLALTKRYVDMIGGAIRVESAKGVGTTFVVDLPVAPAVAPTAAPAAPPTPTARPARKRKPARSGAGILVVEDDPDNQRFLRVLLEPQYTIHTATSGAEAWAVLEAERVHLVVMDISLHGGENGLDLTRRIRADARFGRLPVIAVTAHAFPRDRDNSLAAGCDDYLSKPFRRNELRELIARLLKDRKT